MNPELEEAIVRQSLQDSALMLIEDIEVDDNLDILFGVLLTLKYYSPTAQYTQFFLSLPEEVRELLTDDVDTQFVSAEDGVSVVTAADSALSANLQAIGFKAVMGMIALGCSSIEDVINLASESKSSNAN